MFRTSTIHLLTTDSRFAVCLGIVSAADFDHIRKIHKNWFPVIDKENFSNTFGCFGQRFLFKPFKRCTLLYSVSFHL